MRFSLLFEMQISGPTRESERRLFHECVEQALLAEEVGFDGVWEVEHHGLYEYSHSSAPEVFLAYLAAKTKRLRLGHGVTLTPHRYNHAIRIAERIATLDILSNGRVNWGSGKSASAVEKQAFENDERQLHDQWLEALQMIPRMWREDVFEWKGRFYQVPPTQVVPKPMQQPHPPMFAACTKPESARGVGALGLGALNFALGTDEYLTQKVSDYRQAVAAATPEAYSVTNHFACSPATLVLPDDGKACRHGFRGARFFAEAMGVYYFSGARPVGPIDVPRDFLSDDDLAAAMAFRNAPGSQCNVIIGCPSAARESVSRFVAANVDELVCVMQLGTVPHELVMQSIRTFGEEVIPAFR